MTTYKSILTSDLHGNAQHYEKLKRVVMDQGINFVFLAGDLMPKEGGLWNPNNKIRTIKAQRDFIEGFLIGYINELGKYAEIYAIFGNDDFRSNYSIVAGINKHLHLLDNEIVRLPIKEEVYVAGYPYVTLTPFLQKDWDKWDKSAQLKQYKEYGSGTAYRTKGYTSDGDKYIPINFTKLSSKDTTIEEDLKQLASQNDPVKTIYLMHDAPYDTPLDMVVKDNKYIFSNQHVGSKAIRNFIEYEQPLLTLHGHIHETFHVSGDYKWNYGTSYSITASHDFIGEQLSYVVFDLPTVSQINRYLI